jgi:hypothetical protein
MLDAAANRQALLTAQTSMFTEPNNFWDLDTLPKKVFSMVSQLWITPLQFSETTNYITDLESSISHYKSSFWNNDTFYLIQKGILLVLSSFSLSLGIKMTMRRYPINMRLLLIIGTMLLVGLIMLIFIPLSFQRYYLPIIPFLVLLAGYSIAEIQSFVQNHNKT